MTSFFARFSHFLPALVAAVVVILAERAIEVVNVELFYSGLRSTIADKLGTIRANLEGNINGNAQLVRGLVAVIATEPNITQARFAALAAPLFRNKSQLRNIGGAPGLVIRFMYPMAGNETAIGLDFRKNAAQAEAAERARRVGEIVIAGPVDLVQGGQGFIGRVPVFTETGPDRKETFWGLISAVIDVDKFYRASGLMDRHLAIEIAIRGKDATGAAGPLFYGRQAVFDDRPVLATVSLPHGSWQMAAVPIGGWSQTPDNTWIVRLGFLVAGLLIVVPTGFAGRLMRERRQNLDELLDAKDTADLAWTRLTGAINSIEDGFVIYDADDKLVICNENYRAYYAKSADLIVPGATFEEIIRKGAERGQYPDAEGRIDEWVAERMMVHRQANSELEQRLDDGRWLRIAERKTPGGDTVGFRVDITELKQVELALRQERDFNAALLSSAGAIMVVLNTNGRIVRFNQTAEAVTGYRFSEINDRPFWEVFLPADEYDTVMAGFEDLKAGGNAAARFENRWLMRDGSERLFDWSNATIRDEHGRIEFISSIGVDITEQRKAEEALKASESRFRDTLDHAPALIWIADTDNLGIWYNQRWLEYTGRTMEQEIGIGWLDGVHPDDRKRIGGLCQKAFDRRERFEFEFRLRRADGTWGWIVDTGIPNLDSSGRFDGYIGYCWDVTERKQAESALVVARDEAQRANQAKSQFLSSMSHELRTPLNAIIGFSDLLATDQQAPLTVAQKDSLSHIKKSGYHLLDLINDILELAKIEAGKLVLTVERINARTALEECLSMAAAMAEKRGVTVKKDCPTGDLPPIHVDYTRFKQVLLNLLSNAIKYNVEGGSVTLACEPLDDKRYRFLVRDSGMGIPVDRQDDLFTPFSRLGAENSAIEGTGIGLSITRELVRLMNGEIGFESVQGEGSTFWVDLPLADTSQPEAEAPPSGLTAMSTSAEMIELPPCTVQYIEDNPVNLDLMKMILDRDENVRFISTHTAELGIIQAEHERPDAILMDINLPGISGIEAIAKIRLHETLADVPVIAVSANAMPSEIDEALKAGFVRYITKPFQIREVLHTIAEVLGGDIAATVEINDTPGGAPVGGDGEAALDPEAVAVIRRSAKTFSTRYVDILDRQFAALPDLLAALDDALAENDGKAVETAAHKLKTHSRTLGAAALAATAQEVETMGRDNRLEDADRLRDGLAEHYARVKPAIVDLLAEVRAEAS